MRRRSEMRLSNLSLLVLSLPLALSACDGPGGESGWAVAVDTLANGAVHVVNTPPALDPGPTQILEVEIGIGSVADTGAASFGQLMGLVVTADGRMVVLDGLAQELRVFAADGRHLATHGGKGAGPGEFKGAFGLMIDPDDRLWVPDHMNTRMSILDPQSGFEDSYPLRVIDRAFIWRGAMGANGRILKPSVTMGPPMKNLLRVYDPDMTLVDSLPLSARPDFGAKPPPGSFVWESSDGLSRMVFGAPFYPMAQQLVDPASLIWSTEYGDPSYRIVRWAPGGDTTLILETRRPPTAVSEAQRDSAIAAVRELLVEPGGRDLDWSKLPTVRPAVTGMFLSEEGNLWVQVPSESSALHYDVYDPDGVYAQTVQTSLRVWPFLRPVVRGDRFWAVAIDELDVPYVVRARIVPIAPGACGDDATPDGC